MALFLPKMNGAAQHMPETLIYEMVNGQAIYYKGFKEYLKGEKQLEELMGSSKLQALIIAELIFLLRSFLGEEYLIFANEIGLQFSHRSWRAADIAVIHSSKVEDLDNKYLETAPELVIEIDTKAELSEVNNPLGYYQEKTTDLLNFGIEKVIWIFTETEKVMVAEKGKNWLISDWTENIPVVNGLEINLAELINRRKFK